MSIRDLLRELPVLGGALPPFAPDDAPGRPDELFGSWLREAVEAGVVEPHAMMLGTVDADGWPDARIVLLREVDERGWHFAADAGSAKGRQLAARPVASLGLYWREQGRQVRVRGVVAPLDREASVRDFRARSPVSRAAALAGQPSDVLPDLAELDRAITAAERRVVEEPDAIAERHTVYAVTPANVEFWQGDPQRRHVRLRYRRTAGAWTRELLWP